MIKMLMAKPLILALIATLLVTVLTLVLQPHAWLANRYWGTLVDLLIALNAGLIAYISVRLALRLRKMESDEAERSVSSPQESKNGILHRLGQECLRASRYRHPLSIMVISPISSARNPNDLRLLSATLQKRIRATDWLAVFADHNYLVLLPETPPHEARILAGHIRNGCQQILRTPVHENSQLSRVKIGVCGFIDADVTATDLLDTCMEALRESSHAPSDAIALKILNESALYETVTGQLELRQS